MEDKDLKEQARKYRRITNQVKNLQQDLGILRRRILDEMASRDLKELRLGSTRINVTDITSARIDTGRLWEEAPEVAKVYAVVGTSQRLTVT